MTDPTPDPPAAARRDLERGRHLGDELLADMTTVPGEREVRTGNAGRAGEPEPRERTAAASEGTPATSDLLDGPRRLKRRADLAGDLLALAVTVAVVVGVVVLLAAGLAGVGT